MRVLIVTPAPPRSLIGNRVTAVRWRRLLRKAGVDAHVSTHLEGEPDALLALHARKSAHAAEEFRRRWPERPLVVVLTGTDLYRDLPGSVTARRALAIADRLVVLHPDGARALPPEVRRKTRVVIQSATPVRAGRPSSRTFDVAVVGHLRDEKDPLRAALAARRLPADSRVRIVHAGDALTPEWAERAREEMRRNPRYVWLGERSFHDARALIGRARAVAVTSHFEGGGNVLGEAAVAGTPILSSDFDAARALLGTDYPGLFPVGDTAALTALLARGEREPSFLAALRRATRRQAAQFAPAREQRALLAVLRELAPTATL